MSAAPVESHVGAIVVNICTCKVASVQLLMTAIGLSERVRHYGYSRRNLRGGMCNVMKTRCDLKLTTRRRTFCPRRAASRRRTMVSALFAATECCKARRRSVTAMDGLLSRQDGCKNIGVLLGQLIYHISTERANASVVLRSSSLWVAGTARYDGRGCKISRTMKLGAC